MDLAPVARATGSSAGRPGQPRSGRPARGRRTSSAQRARAVLEQAGPVGHIFNLGHGILPQTPPDHARVLVDAVRECIVAEGGMSADAFARHRRPASEVRPAGPALHVVSHGRGVPRGIRRHGVSRPSGRGRSDAGTHPLSLYLHLPFCEERCTFCGCMVVITKKRDVAATLSRLPEARDRHARRRPFRSSPRRAIPLGRRHADLPRARRRWRDLHQAVATPFRHRPRRRSRPSKSTRA